MARHHDPDKPGLTLADFFYKASLAILPRLYVWVTRLWFSTCRCTLRGEQHFEAARKQGAIVVPFWHYSILYIFHHVRVQRYPAVVLVSASRDGEYIARIAGLLAVGTVRGSSNHQGVRALKRLLQCMRDGHNVGIVADGSQGPARRVQPGTIFLASKTGAPIMPMVWAADRYKAFRSWDRTVLPMPFCRIIMRYGEPMHVPPQLKAEDLEKFRLRLERQMNDLYHQVWAECGRVRHDRGPEAKEDR